MGVGTRVGAGGEMATFKKNLLEAFQDANDERTGGNPVSGGPFAGPLPDDPSASVRPNWLPEFSPRDTRTLMFAAGGAIAIFVAGVAVGSWFGVQEPAAAAERSGVTSVQTESAERGASEEELLPATELRAGEEVNAALGDPRNTYSILAVTYGDEPRDLELAYATYHHFAGLGLPVAHPLSFEGRIYVLVGAAPTKDELAALRERVRSARGPTGREGEFSEAYFVNLDAARLR